uniref:Low density lipoprotein receptor adaptor protein 1 n=1 Tax=Pavo cristatus TaxID=9049 RepID=A0A8C9ER27_PAVCR
MDALRSAGRALLRSPSVTKPPWAGGRHQKLPENWTDTRETLLEGVLFSLKYLGMTLVEQPKGEELSAAAVKRIVATAKASGKKLQKVTLKVSPRGIVLNDSGTNELIENVSIYRCVMGHPALSPPLCLCPAQAVTLTVAQAFKIAFEFWQASKEGEESNCCKKGLVLCYFFPLLPHSLSSLFTAAATGNLLDLEDPAKLLLTSSENPTHLDNSITQAMNCMHLCSYFLFFSPLRLAQSRTNPYVLDTGLTAQDIQSAEMLSSVDWNKIDSSTGEKDDLFMF